MPHLLSDLPRFDVHALRDLEDPYGSLDWSAFPRGMGSSARGLELLSYDLVGKAYRSTDLRNSTVAKMTAIGLKDGPVFDALTGMTTSTEGQEHRRMRRAFQSWFIADNVEKFRTEIRDYIDAWMRDNSDGIVDFATELGTSLPAMVFTQIVGASTDDCDLIAHLSADILLFPSFDPDVRDRVEKGTLELLDWLGHLIEDKLAHPGSDLTSALLAAERDGAISRDHTRRILVTLVVASTESTRAQMSCNLATLAANPEQWQVLRENPQIMGTAVQELYRYNPATLATSRYSEQPLLFEGVELDAFQPVFLNRFSANNDPAAYDNPRTLDARRVGARPPFTFGNGRHSCVGRMIAAIEQEEVIASALQHWRTFEIAHVEWGGFPFIKSPVSMTLDVVAR